MSKIWNFSPSLKDQVHLCITAGRKDEQNKWSKEFGHFKFEPKLGPNFPAETLIDLCNSQERSPVGAVENNENVGVAVNELQTKLSCELQAKNVEELIDGLETDIHSNFDDMVKASSDNYMLLSILAKKLSTTTIEKLCTAIFDRKDINQLFLSRFFEYFLPSYIKREYNSNTLDILIRGDKRCPLEFRTLLRTIVKDTEIPTKVLHDYVESLNENDRSKFVINLAELDLSGEEFVNNLFSIYSAYKDSTKSERLQNCIQTMLLQYSSVCVTDRNFGRLILAYLQAQKCMKVSADYENLETVLEAHRSPFKRPCLMLIKELTSNNDLNSSSSEDSE